MDKGWHKRAARAPKGFARYRDLEADYGLPYTRPTLARLEKAGQFPKRIHLSPGVIVWRRNEIKAWLQARAAARHGEVPSCPGGDA